MIAYRTRYGYPWKWALAAEVAWRIEHLPLSDEGKVLAPIARWGYRMRKSFERRASR